MNVIPFRHAGDEDLQDRVTLTIELPRFAVRGLEYRASFINGGAAPEDLVTVNDVIEWYLVSPLSLQELPHLEAAIPGFANAVAKWIFETNCQPPVEL